MCERIKITEYTDKTSAFDLMSLLGYIQDMKLRNYLHGISYEEYTKYNYSEAITNEMWARSETHLTKLFDEGKMFENFLSIPKDLHKPLILINGLYDPACGENQIRYIKENVSNVKQVLFENSGHFLRIEEAEKYTQFVTDFLIGL